MISRALRLGIGALTVLGLTAGLAPAASAAGTDGTAVKCRKSDFCLFSGPHQSGQVLYRIDVKVTRTGFHFPEVDALDPVITPRSARNPIPDSFGCIVRLNDKPHFAGDEQEISGSGDAELTGAPVGSITPDCG
ncbi:hypothetical protein ACFP1Z_27630 [Streptomyces gamaensis]|uniref:Peptidase inhibitor family I36 n=1 Tax=Streptomyces gamaensis TaxID=1763542 RepID=A0ABW0Z679_9ACTN